MRRANFARLTALTALALAFAFPHGAGGQEEARGVTDALRGGTPIPDAPLPPRLESPVNDDRRRVRNYPEQPPVIPHDIRGYEITRNANKCMECHSRRGAPAAGAPMISVSHFMDRDFMVLTEVSPRRYFCNQCHVPQTSAAELIGNEFIDGADLRP